MSSAETDTSSTVPDRTSWRPVCPDGTGLSLFAERGESTARASDPARVVTSPVPCMPVAPTSRGSPVSALLRADPPLVAPVRLVPSLFHVPADGEGELHRRGEAVRRLHGHRAEAGLGEGGGDVA